MNIKIFDDFHGQSIKIDGECYKFIEITQELSDSDEKEIQGFFEDCLECGESEPISSSSSGPCTRRCKYTVSFNTLNHSNISFQIFDESGLRLSTGPLTTNYDYYTYVVEDALCSITICANRPEGGVYWIRGNKGSGDADCQKVEFRTGGGFSSEPTYHCIPEEYFILEPHNGMEFEEGYFDDLGTSSSSSEWV